MKKNYNSWVHLSHWSFFNEDIIFPRKCNKGDNVYHNHDFFEIVCVTSGTIKHIVNDIEQNLITGDILFIRPEDKHLYLREQNNTCVHYDVLCQAKLFENVCKFINDDFLAYYKQPLIPPKAHVSPEKMSEIKKKLVAYNKLNSPEQKQLTSKFILMNLLEFFTFSFKEESKKESNDWLDILLQELSVPKNFERTISDLLSNIPYNSNYICRAFKKRMGITITEYFNDQKLLYAASNLSFTNLPIINIALESGFDSISYFNKIFKQKFNCTPSTFRKNNQSSFKK